MAGMAMSLRVVVPPHPLIAHWLTLLRDRTTPSPLYATAMEELGRWLTYEALRDWLPQRSVEVPTATGTAEGRVADPDVPILAVPVLPDGLGLWQGARAVLPAAHVAPMVQDGRRPEAGGPGPAAAFWSLDSLPSGLGSRVGVLLFLAQTASGRTAVELLQRLRTLQVSGPRLRLVTALATGPALQAIAAVEPDLTIYCAGIDAGLDEGRQPQPGIGPVGERLLGGAPAEERLR
jgi:uracil phosphoribosyltransferase